MADGNDVSRARRNFADIVIAERIRMDASGCSARIGYRNPRPKNSASPRCRHSSADGDAGGGRAGRFDDERSVVINAARRADSHVLIAALTLESVTVFRLFLLPALEI